MPDKERFIYADGSWFRAASCDLTHYSREDGGAQMALLHFTDREGNASQTIRLSLKGMRQVTSLFVEALADMEAADES